MARRPYRWNPPRAREMKRLRVVLVNPPPLAVVEPWYDRPDWGRIALAYLAGWLQRDAAIEVFVVDAKLERLTFEQVQSRVAALEADALRRVALVRAVAVRAVGARPAGVARALVLVHRNGGISVGVAASAVHTRRLVALGRVRAAGGGVGAGLRWLLCRGGGMRES